jgi:hypothetical protein
MKGISMDKICNRCGECYGVHNGTTCRDGGTGGFDDKDEKPVTEFKAGNWYRLVKPLPYNPRMYGDMVVACDGKPHLCTYASCDGSTQFEGQEGTRWTYPAHCFIEVPEPVEKELSYDLHGLNCQCIIPSPIMINGKMFLEKYGIAPIEKTSISSKAQRRREILARLKIE